MRGERDTRLTCRSRHVGALPLSYGRQCLPMGFEPTTTRLRGEVTESCSPDTSFAPHSTQDQMRHRMTR